jgi:hypothetical protein
MCSGGAEGAGGRRRKRGVSGVVGTPTFFINGRRHHGASDVAALIEAVRAERDRTALTR